MDFSWTPEQEEMFSAARGAARTKTRAYGADSANELDGDGWRACGELGLLGLCLPREYGGLGLDFVATARMIEGFGEGCRGLGLLFSACSHLLAGSLPIAKSGSDELKRRLLPRLASGDWIGANAITESEAGSDVLALESRAERQGSAYRLNGSKIYVTNGPVADLAIVYATTNPGAGHLSISAFAVELDAPGVVVEPAYDVRGLRGAPIGALRFEDVDVPTASRLGAEGQGALVFEAAMQCERACLFAAYLGAMQRQLDEVIEFAATRRQFGRPIGKNQSIAHRIVDMKLRLEGARHLVYRACWAIDQKEDTTALSVSLAKLAVSEAAVQSGIDAVHIHGGLGVMADTEVDRGLLDALPATIFSGTSEMQREMVARRLGL